MNPTLEPANAAGQRVLLINAATWAFLLIVLGYGVFHPASPPARFAEEGIRDLPNTDGAFLVAPLPGAASYGGGFAGGSAVKSSAPTAPERPQPAVKIHGMAAARPRGDGPAATNKPASTEKDKTMPAKNGTEKPAPATHPDAEAALPPAPQRVHIGGYAPAKPSKQ